MSRQSIAVLAFDRISAFHLAVPCAVFGERHPGVPECTFTVCAERPGLLTTNSGFRIEVADDLRVLESADTVIVPSWRDPAERPPQAILDALSAARQRGAQLVGLCLGAYVLAEAGLLDGRRATTHWACAQDFARRYPAVRVDAAVLYVEDDGLVTSAGTAAGLDCCLHLVRRWHGAEVANSIARRLVVPPHRSGGQAQFIEHPIPATAQDSRLSELLDWVRANLYAPHSLDSLAGKALMSRRTFSRHFRQLTGTTPGVWLQGERLAQVQRLLESTEQSVEHIARLAGFGSPESLRLHFRRAFGVSPLVWRQTFRGRDGT
ncbi:GlxA family transcriptional regulator [Azonexus sp.]|uniref:GlxA family transcriptional regulator n=1 Tax=Azonexus sp. TaxID=1872668 RepID=UPI0027BA516B|nr:helix-turn-helix domain-containing protein [Azonexus sp.]